MTSTDAPFAVTLRYDPVLRRWRAEVFAGAEMVFVAVRAKRDAADHVARCWTASYAADRYRNG